ncbi:MAG: DNA-binding protein [Clostridia bacterium]|nr:DNA-binding protein [Clostridia bacterium]
MARLYVSFPALVAVIGEADAARLCERHGGLALYITQKPERCSLNGIISGVAIESLCAEFPGIEILLPIGPHRKPPLKESIVSMLEAGVSHSAIARELRCTSRYVEMVSRDAGFNKPRAVKPKVQKPKRRVAKQEILATLKNNTESLSVKEVAAKFGVNPHYVYDLRREHEIPPYKPRTGVAGEA